MNITPESSVIMDAMLVFLVVMNVARRKAFETGFQFGGHNTNVGLSSWHLDGDIKSGDL